MGKINNVLMRINSIKVELFMPFFNHNVTIGKGLSIRKNVSINANGGVIAIGKGAFINSNSSINSRKKVSIGDFFLCGENVHIYDHNHGYRRINEPKANQDFKCAPVNIGNNVWLGSNVIVLAGVTIGNNCVIGANCLIYEDVPDNTVVKCDQSLIIEKICDI